MDALLVFFVAHVSLRDHVIAVRTPSHTGTRIEYIRPWLLLIRASGPDTPIRLIEICVLYNKQGVQNIFHSENDSINPR